MCEGTRGGRGTRRSRESGKVITGARWRSVVYREFASECRRRELMQSRVIHYLPSTPLGIRFEILVQNAKPVPIENGKLQTASQMSDFGFA